MNTKAHKLNIKTVITSNGGKWGGEEQATINELLDVLKAEVIEERFFKQYTHNKEKFNFCPIKTEDGETYRFLGNFENLSWVFKITTNDPELIKKLTKAIKDNKGWVDYYEKNLIKDKSLPAILTKAA